MLQARAVLALALANARYWTTVAPHARAQLRRWERAARAIPDPVLRGLALEKLAGEGFNAQLAATLATPAPRSRRGTVVEAIVALQAMYDYLDALGEQPGGGPERDARLAGAFTAAFEPGAAPGGAAWSAGDGGYLQALIAAVRSALAKLPAHAAVAPAARAAAARCAQAQTLNHAACDPRAEVDRLRRRWAPRTSGADLRWQELLAGASASVIALHALIAAAAEDGATREQAIAIEEAYLWIGALTMLDSVVDRDRDLGAGQTGYVDYYGGDADLMGARLAQIARHGAERARALPHAAHHAMTLAGVIAHYASAPSADSELARPVFARVRADLRPSIAPALMLMRAWRLAKRASERCSGRSPDARRTRRANRQPARRPDTQRTERANTQPARRANRQPARRPDTPPAHPPAPEPVAAAPHRQHRSRVTAKVEERERSLT